MASYTITTGTTQSFIVASSPERAAEIYCHRANRRRLAQRTTGKANCSGQFQGYEPVRGGGLNSAGPVFQVRESWMVRSAGTVEDTHNEAMARS